MTDTDYREFERWAVQQVGCSPYSALRFLDDVKGTGSPKWCKPYRTWSDGKRLYRNHSSSMSSHESRDNDTTVDKADRDLSHQMDLGAGGKSLLALHIEMNAGTGSSPKGRQGWTRGYGFEQKANPDQLEVCRRCGADLGLPRDDYGYAIREFETQRQYCSDRCKADADNAKDRQRRAGGKFPKDDRNRYLSPTEFDLKSITVAGAGRLPIPPEGWNRANPRRNPHLVRPRPGNHRDVFKLPLHEYIWQRRDGHGRCPDVHRWRDSRSRMPNSWAGWTVRHDRVWKVTTRDGALAP